MDKKFKHFIKTLNDMASMNSGSKKQKYFLNYKAPYKPALMLAIFSVTKEETINPFNFWMCFDEYIPGSLEWKIIKKYYDILMSIEEVYDILKEFSDKTIRLSIEIGFNIEIYKGLVNHAFQLPLKRMSKNLEQNNSNFIEIQKPKKLKLNCDEQDINTTLNFLIMESYKSLIKTNLGFEKYNIEEILNYDSVILNEINNLESKKLDTSIINLEKKYSKVEIRPYQHWWSKAVKDNDTKCIVCCEKTPWLLEAAHIKPYSHCDNNSEKLDINNGITLCLTHHRLFDKGYFTFNQDWTVKISNAPEFQFYKEDLDLKIKQHESCLNQLKTTKANVKNDYLKYRYNNIFKWIN